MLTPYPLTIFRVGGHHRLNICLSLRRKYLIVWPYSSVFHLLFPDVKIKLRLKRIRWWGRRFAATISGHQTSLTCSQLWIKKVHNQSNRCPPSTTMPCSNLLSPSTSTTFGKFAARTDSSFSHANGSSGVAAEPFSLGYLCYLYTCRGLSSTQTDRHYTNPFSSICLVFGPLFNPFLEIRRFWLSCFGTLANCFNFKYEILSQNLSICIF